MPSPFPGMDPYLEHPSQFPTLHGQMINYYVYPIQLAERLPEIAVPLLPGDPAVPIDLQAVLDRCYDVGPYRREINYRDDTPHPPLRPEQMSWARGVLDAARGGSGTVQE